MARSLPVNSLLFIFESCEAASYEAGIATLLQLYPQLFEHDPSTVEHLWSFFTRWGSTIPPSWLCVRSLEQAKACNWKRVGDSRVPASGEDLLAWFRELVRPSRVQPYRSSSQRNDTRPSIRDLIHLLAHGHRVRDRALRAAAKKRDLESKLSFSCRQQS